MDRRLKLFLILNTCFILLWISHLFVVQNLDPHNLKDTIYIRTHPSKKIVIPERGNIFDSSGNLLVSSIKYYQIDADIRSIRNYCKRNDGEELKDHLCKIAEIIGRNCDVKTEQLKSHLLKLSKCNNLMVSEDITESQLINIKREMEAEDLSGIVPTFRKLERTYPKDKLAASLLGMVKSNAPTGEVPKNSFFEINGITGLESTWNDALSGKFGWKESIRDANNKRIPFLFLQERSAKNGNHLYLTLDTKIQEILEESLNKGLHKFKAKNAIGVIMEPESGAIVAMAGITNTDRKKDAALLRALPNLASGAMFEPGSTLKPFTALIAVEDDIYTGSDMIDCRKYIIDDRIIKDSHEHKKLSFRDIIAYSSNVGISKIVEKVGSEKLYQRLIDHGFGQKTGSNLQGEASGILRKLKDWQGYSLHSISFGQEISVTALQLTNAYCTLANNGKVMQPYLVKEIRNDKNEIVEKITPKVLRTISNKHSLDTLKVYLRNVVDYGTAVATKLDYIDIAGKTGTAEKIIKGETTYSKDKYTSLFAGFFPVDNPRYAMVIVFDEPDYTYHYSSASAVPVFKEIVERMLNHSDNDLIADLKGTGIHYTTMPDITGKTREESIEILQKKNIKYNLLIKNPGVVTNQYPQPGVAFNSNEKVIIILDKEEIQKSQIDLDYQMPNLTGLTVRKALDIALKCNIRLSIKGNGIIYNQSISAGSKTEYGEICQIKAK